MHRLPPELRIKILLYLTSDFKTLENLKKVFPHDPLIEQASQTIQAIIIKGKAPFNNLNLKLPLDNKHEADDILFNETHFQYPVDCLYLINQHFKCSDSNPGAMMQNICQFFDKETNLLKVRTLFLIDFDCTFRDHRWDALNLLVKKSPKSNGVASHNRTRFPNVEVLILSMSYCSDIPLLPNLKKLSIHSYRIRCDFKNLTKLCNLKILIMSQRGIRLGSRITLNSKFKFPKLEYLSLTNYHSNIEDFFDRNLPRLKFLSIIYNRLERVPKFAMTTLEELNIKLPDGADLENLSTLVNLKTLHVRGRNFQINGISQLQNLKTLSLSKSISAGRGNVKIDLDDGLPKNLETLSITGLEFKLKSPLKLKTLKVANMRALTIGKLNAELSVLDIRKSYIEEIRCDVSHLTKIMIGECIFDDGQTFTFNDKESFQQQYKAFTDYCRLHNIKFNPMTMKENNNTIGIPYYSS